MTATATFTVQMGPGGPLHPYTVTCETERDALLARSAIIEFLRSGKLTKLLRERDELMIEKGGAAGAKAGIEIAALGFVIGEAAGTFRGAMMRPQSPEITTVPVVVDGAPVES